MFIGNIKKIYLNIFFKKYRKNIYNIILFIYFLFFFHHNNI